MVKSDARIFDVQTRYGDFFVTVPDPEAGPLPYTGAVPDQVRDSAV